MIGGDYWLTRFYFFLTAQTRMHLGLEEVTWDWPDPPPPPPYNWRSVADWRL